MMSLTSQNYPPTFSALPKLLATRQLSVATANVLKLGKTIGNWFATYALKRKMVPFPAFVLHQLRTLMKKAIVSRIPLSRICEPTISSAIWELSPHAPRQNIWASLLVVVPFKNVSIAVSAKLVRRICPRLVKKFRNQAISSPQILVPAVAQLMEAPNIGFLSSIMLPI